MVLIEGMQMYLPVYKFLLIIHVLRDIAFPTPVLISNIQVACRNCRHLMSLYHSSPTITGAKKSSIMKELFCL